LDSLRAENQEDKLLIVRLDYFLILPLDIKINFIHLQSQNLGVLLSCSLYSICRCSSVGQSYWFV